MTPSPPRHAQLALSRSEQPTHALLTHVQAELDERLVRPVQRSALAHGATPRFRQVKSEGQVAPNRRTGCETMRAYHSAMQELAGTRWGVLRASDGQAFICPDRPSNELYIPISRNTALVAGYGDLSVGEETVRDLNRASARQAEEYVFGHPEEMAAFLADNWPGWPLKPAASPSGGAR